MTCGFEKTIKENASIMTLDKIFGVYILYITNVNVFVEKFNHTDFFKDCYNNNVLYIEIFGFTSRFNSTDKHYQKIVREQISKNVYEYKLNTYISDNDLQNSIKKDRIAKLKTIIE